MAFRATLNLGGKEFDVLDCSYSLKRDTDSKGRPASNIYGGLVNVHVESTEDMAPVGLLLTETELDEIKTWVEMLSSMKPDIKGKVASVNQKARHVRRVRGELRGIPADVPDESGDGRKISADTLGAGKYAPTGAIRRNLRKSYPHALDSCVFEGRSRSLTLARAQEYITTMPTISPELNGTTIKGLKSRKTFTDRELDMLVEYFEEHKALIESQARPFEDLTVPDSEKFFFLPSGVMP